MVLLRPGRHRMAAALAHYRQAGPGPTLKLERGGQGIGNFVRWGGRTHGCSGATHFDPLTRTGTAADIDQIPTLVYFS